MLCFFLFLIIMKDFRKLFFFSVYNSFYVMGYFIFQFFFIVNFIRICIIVFIIQCIVIKIFLILYFINMSKYFWIKRRFGKEFFFIAIVIGINKFILICGLIINNIVREIFYQFKIFNKAIVIFKSDCFRFNLFILEYFFYFSIIGEYKSILFIRKIIMKLFFVAIVISIYINIIFLWFFIYKIFSIIIFIGVIIFNFICGRVILI